MKATDEEEKKNIEVNEAHLQVNSFPKLTDVE